ncbi:MAG TPA: hypothetical protein VF808_03785 [Ktedonobacterales bacterium]
MRISKRHMSIIASGLGILTLVASLLVITASRSGAVQAATKGTLLHLRYAGKTSVGAAKKVKATGGVSVEIGPQVDKQIPHSSNVVHVAASSVPRPASNGVTSTNPGLQQGFTGVTHFDQRFAGTGAYTNTQFSLEPPDQALCAGNGFVVEAVNNALNVYSTSGGLLAGPTAMSQFLQVAPEVIRSNPPVFGPFISDPKCYFDSSTSRWFITELELDVDPVTGAFTGSSHQYVAVSDSADPTGSFTIYNFATTDDGSAGTPSHPNCPCFGDQPLIGADANGFYVSTNEFPVFANGFNGAQVYAISKTGLESGSLPPVEQINAGAMTTPDAGGVWYSVQPATTPPGGAFESANNGTEYFLSALQFSNRSPLDDRIATWALTNTASLNTSAPSASLSEVVVTTEIYGQPPNAQQRSGSTPYGDFVHGPLGLLDGNDDRMNQVVFAAGSLWAGVNTVVQPPNGPTRVGIAYFKITPSDPSGTLSASVASQGYVSVNQQNTLFPSIGVNAAGKGVIVFTLVGSSYYPSAAYMVLGGDGSVHIAGAGRGPDDGFTEYKGPGGGVSGRWGDYSAAVADSDGSIWTATEYIGQTCTDAQFAADTTCGGTRSFYANWGTFVGNVMP